MSDPTSSPIRSPLAEAAVYRAVQLIEEDGPLDDAAALRAAMSRADDRSRLLERAWILGQRLGLPAEWARWRSLGGGVLVGLALAVALGAWLLAGAVLGERQINAVGAFFALLGLHAITWTLWLASLFVRWPSGGTLNLGRLALALTARLPLDRGPHAIQLLRATQQVLGRARLAPWLFGGLSHAVWSLSFVVLLAGLALGFSLRAYRLTWETTILTPAVFVDFVQATGRLPGWLGFPEPDAATLLAGAGGADQRGWAWWLIGCVAVYGLGLRLASGLACAIAWRLARARLAPDLAEPAARRLLARFHALAPVQVLDDERPGPATAPSPQPPRPLPAGHRAIGFELPPEADWPDERLAGSQDEREALLQSLAAAPPQRLLLACHAPSSPDRGTARLLREAAALAGETALLFDGGAPPRWRDWLAAQGLGALVLIEDRPAAQAWLEARA